MYFFGKTNDLIVYPGGSSDVFMKKINYGRGGRVEAAGYCFKWNQRDLTKMKKKETKK